MFIPRFSHFFEREFTGVHQAAFLLAFTSLFAKILALVRDRLLASTFGAGETLDMYYASFRIPDFLYTVSLFLSASAVLIPLLLKKEFEGRKQANEFVGMIFSWFILGMVIIGAVLFFAMPALNRMVAPGFSETGQRWVTVLSHILIIQAFFLGLSNIAGSVIQSFRLFFVYALSPIVYNIGIVFGVLFFYPLWGLPGLVWGAVLGAFLHFAIQLPSLLRLHFIPRFSFRITPALKHVLFLSLPRTIGLTINQFVFIGMTAFASLFGLGSIAVFQLAYNLETVPLSVIGLSYSVAAFPFLASIFAREEKKKFLSYVSLAFRHIVFWSLPLTVLLIVLRAHVVRIILGAGNFGWVDTRLTAAALALFALSLIAQSLVMLYVRAFYAAGKTILPVVINVMSAAFILISSFFFIWLYDTSSGFASLFSSILRVSDIPNAKMLILPFVFSLGSILNVLLLSIFFLYDFGSAGGKHFVRSLSEMAGASCVIGAVTFYTLRLLDTIFNLETFAGVFMQGTLAGCAGIIAGGIVLFLFKNQEMFELKNALARRFWKVPIVAKDVSSATELQ